MRRIYHPYWQWEDYRSGMWRKISADEESEMLKRAIEFTGNAELYGSFMLRVAQEYRYACEHNLSEVGMNRRAWIGHAAANLAIGSPEYITRRAWWMLTEQQRIDADAQADAAIRHWEHAQNSAQIEIVFV